MTLLIVTDPDTACMRCSSPLIPGQVYSEQLLGVCDDLPVVEEWCLRCSFQEAS